MRTISSKKWLIFRFLQRSKTILRDSRSWWNFIMEGLIHMTEKIWVIKLFLANSNFFCSFRKLLLLAHATLFRDNDDLLIFHKNAFLFTPKLPNLFLTFYQKFLSKKKKIFKILKCTNFWTKYERKCPKTGKICKNMQFSVKYAKLCKEKYRSF